MLRVFLKQSSPHYCTSAMDYIDRIPDFVDPLLLLLESALPPHVYSVLVTICSHTVALTSALLSFLATSPSTWTAQTIIPPVITILAAYLVISSLYRTIRFTFWFIKWGTILATLFGGVGWFMSGGMGDFLAQRGGDVGRRTGSSSSRPRAWDSWDRHDTYRQERQRRVPPGDAADDVQQFVQELAGAAGSVYAQSGDWWEAAKGVAQEISKRASEGTEKRKSKLKSGKTARTR